MSRIEMLIRNYANFVALPWEQRLSGVQRVWFAIYDEHDERRLRAKLGEFELATKQAKHGWHVLDMTDAFAEWLADNPYRENYFFEPEYLDKNALENFHNHIRQKVEAALQHAAVNENTVVALLGVGSLFGFTKVSRLIEDVEGQIRGRLLVFFPGERDNNNYRLLDARDGWNYMAVPITA